MGQHSLLNIYKMLHSEEESIRNIAVECIRILYPEWYHKLSYNSYKLITLTRINYFTHFGKQISYYTREPTLKMSRATYTLEEFYHLIEKNEQDKVNN